jgi:hypothetical protein
MKRTSSFLIVMLFSCATAVSQQPPSGPAPTKEDIDKYYEATHTRELMKGVMEAMFNQSRQLMRDEMKKRVPDATPEMLDKATRQMDDFLHRLDLEALLQAMTPVYQKHLTKPDLDAMTTFYSSPSGQRILKEMPAMTSEAMQASRELVRKQIEVAARKTDEFVATMEKDAKAKSKSN